MKIREIITEAKTPSTLKPRNFVAKNAVKTTSGAGAHRDKKKEQKQGYEKHKKKEVAEENLDRELDINFKNISEEASQGASSAADMGIIANPHISPGPARRKRNYKGSPGKSGTKSPAQPKVSQPKNSDGTAKAAHDIKGASLFGGPTIKR